MTTHAIVTQTNGYETPAVRRQGRWHRLGTAGDSITPWFIESTRPLALVDLSDPQQINQLAAQLRKLQDSEHYLSNDDVHKALSEFAGPPPEPPNLGSVIEDFDGTVWVRDARYRSRWYNPKDGKRADFADISAVRVLSYGAEGVQ